MFFAEAGYFIFSMFNCKIQLNMSVYDSEDDFNEPASENRRKEDSDQQKYQPIGKHLREKSSQKELPKNNTLLINDLIGYGSGLLFFGLSLFIFFGFFDSPGMTPEYRSILSLILFLYGVYRVVTTKGKSNAAKRRERLKKHRSERTTEYNKY